MRQRYVQIDGVLVPRDEETAAMHYVQPDIPGFMANTGTFVEGKVAWREHLKERGCEETSIDEVKARGVAWQKRKEAFREKLKDAAKLAPQREIPETYDQVAQRPRIAAEVLNRLHGRPAPDRKTLIKITLETAKRMNHGRR